jgi:glycosyltransferase involved in cell wall biosynthesis
VRVAVFEPVPRLCGVTAYAFHVVEGLRALGHEADVVSFTKSGRPYAVARRDGRPRDGWRWYHRTPDVVRPWSTGAATLDGYDLVLLNEPKCGALDTVGTKERRLPDYLEVLSRTRTPWTSVLHDNAAYRPDKAQFLPAALELKNFTGVLVECQVGAYESIRWADADRYVRKVLSWPWLPYVPQFDGMTPVADRPPVVGMTGRMTSTKRYPSLLSVADRVPSPYEVRIYGGEAGGAAPAATYNWYEMLATHHGWTGLRGTPAEKNVHRTNAIGNWAPMSSTTPYGMRHPDGGVIRYMGPYQDLAAVYDDIQVYVSLSTPDLITKLEYTIIEGLDAGCVVVTPPYATKDMRGADYGIVFADGYSQGVKTSKTTGMTWHDPREERGLLDALRRAVDLVPSYDPTAARAAVARYHDPRHLVRALLEQL